MLQCPGSNIIEYKNLSIYSSCVCGPIKHRPKLNHFEVSVLSLDARVKKGAHAQWSDSCIFFLNYYR